jgi:hypothetical protein
MQITLHPARLVGTKFVTDREQDTVSMEWAEFRDRLVPMRRRNALILLRQLKPGMFVGTRKRGHDRRLFVLDAVGKSSDVARVLVKDPNLRTDLVDLFFVNSVNWDSRVTV